MPYQPSELNKHFTKVPPAPGAQNHVLCNHCKNPARKIDSKSLRRKKAHLGKCLPYQIWLEDQTIMQEVREDNSVAPASSSTLNLDGTRPWSEMPFTIEQRRVRMAAMAIYASGLPLSLFDKEYHPEMVEFIKDTDPDFDGYSIDAIAEVIGECKREKEHRSMQQQHQQQAAAQHDHYPIETSQLERTAAGIQRHIPPSLLPHQLQHNPNPAANPSGRSVLPNPFNPKHRQI